VRGKCYELTACSILCVHVSLHGFFLVEQNGVAPVAALFIEGVPPLIAPLPGAVIPPSVRGKSPPIPPDGSILFMRSRLFTWFLSGGAERGRAGRCALHWGCHPSDRPSSRGCHPPTSSGEVSPDSP
jgi:hypothetical protein